MDTLVLGTDSSPSSLDPRIGIDKASEDFHHLLFNGLLKKDEHDRMVPDLAESYEKVSPTFYRFHLRHGVRFHNGKLLDAEDVVFTYRSVLDGKIASTKKSSLETIEWIRSRGPDTVELSLREPFNGLLVNLNLGIIPRNSGPDFARNPIGTGPYRLLEFHLDGDARLEKFSAFFRPPPRIRFLTIRMIPDATTRALELEKGTIDLLMGPQVVPPDYLRILKSAPGLKAITAPGNNYAYIGFNLRDPILKNKLVRQAIGYAINRQAWINNLFYGAANPATGMLGPQHWSYEGNVRQLSYDPALSRHLLDEAGYPDPDGPGPAKRFWLTHKISTNEFRRVVATILQRDLNAVGIGLKVRSYEWGTFFADINHGNFQMCMLMWVGESDPDIYRDVFSTGGMRNRGKYSDRRVDDWVLRAKVAGTEDEQKRYYSLIQKKIAEDCPYISLWYESNMAIMRSELAGLRLTPDADTVALKDVYWQN